MFELLCYWTPPKRLDRFWWNYLSVFEWVSEWFRQTLDSPLDKASPTRNCDQTGILRFTMEIIVYKWLLLVTGELISKNWHIFFVYKCFPLVNLADEVKASIKSSCLWFRINKLYPQTNLRHECIFVVLYRFTKTSKPIHANFKFLIFNTIILMLLLELKEIWYINFVQMYLFKIGTNFWPGQRWVEQLYTIYICLL